MADAPPFRPIRLDHVVLRSPAPERLVAFYRDVLGCRVERINEKAGLWHLRVGDSLVDIVRIAGDDPAPLGAGRNVDHLCLGVAPWDEAAIRAHLSAHGIGAGETARRYGAEGHGPSIYLTDPEGNGVELKGPPEA